MSTVQANVLKLLARVDPSLKTGAEITSTNIATWASAGSDRFTAQRIVDCYNEARKVLGNAISMRYNPAQKVAAMADIMILKSDLTFASGSATKPTGYIEAYSLHKATGQQIAIIPSHLYAVTAYLDSAYNPIVHEYATTFVAVNGATNVPDLATYKLRYFGLTDFTIANVSAGTENETFSFIWDTILVELASAIADEQGAAQVNALAMKLITQGQ